MAACNDIGSHQPVSGIPGNIGIVKCKAVVWDHDPFLARPPQTFSFPFSSKTKDQMPEAAENMQFEAGAGFLKGTGRLQDMFVCTENQDFEQFSSSSISSSSTDNVNSLIDLVGSEASGNGKAAWDYLPGGNIYECDGGRTVTNNDGGEATYPSACYKDVPAESPDGNLIETKSVPIIDKLTGKSLFPHQLWVHIGNLFDPLIYRHPSEYNDQDLQALIDKRKRIGPTLTGSQSDNEINDLIESSAVWDYILNTNNGKTSVWLQQTNKQKKLPVHWTIEKYTPVWQGTDFSISVKFEDTKTDDFKDPNETDITETLIPRDPFYSYLMYQPDPQTLPVGNVFSDDTITWAEGISNEAFYILSDMDLGKIYQSKIDMRKQYHWKYKTYLLIEVGPNHPHHRYFIELVKGRNPRLLHLGEEWDNPTRITLGTNNPEEQKFSYIMKCRVLDTYENISCDDLFTQKEFSFNVRNHCGRLVITFKGKEDQPWVITRKDNEPRSNNYKKQIVPMVIPNDVIRIHGGNISAQINYSPTEYINSATVYFYDRQVDSYGLGDSDIYMTCSTIGASIKHLQKKAKMQSIFNSNKLKNERLGYACDSYQNTEIIRNVPTTINIYELYSSQWQSYGKGFVYQTPLDQSTFTVQTNSETGLPLSKKLMNKLHPSYGGTPHSITIFNAKNKNRGFHIGLDDNEIDSRYPYKEYASSWDVGITLQAGTIIMDPPTGTRGPIGDEKPVAFTNYITPIIQSWRLLVLGGGKPIADNIGGTINPLNIAPLIVSLSDSWNADNLSSINHEMQVKCYIPMGPPIGGDPNIIKTESEQERFSKEIYDLGQSLLSLHNKSFYLTISYWWDIGIGKREAPENILNSRFTLDDNPLLIQMTGVAYGAQLDLSANKLYMSFQVKDYMSIMKNQLIFNSPFFDAVQDVQAVFELAKMCGFDDNPAPEIGVDRRPLGYLQKVLEDTESTNPNSKGRSSLVHDSTFYYNGEKSICERFDLPGSYADLADPAVKFNNGDTFESCVKRIAEISGKCVYFDRWGVLRLETLPAMLAAFATNDNLSRFKPIMDFVTSPFPLASAGEEGSSTDFVFDPSQHAAHLVWNSIKYQRSVEDCVNQIVLLSASNDIKLADGSLTGGFIVEGYTFYEQLWDPTAEGFLGYRKPFYQSNGVFGGLDQVRKGLQHYAKMKYPPITMSFETFGVPGIKALDIVSLDGNLMYIKEISHEIDPANNKWWMNISGEWLKPFSGDLGFLKAKGSTDSQQQTGTNDGNPQNPGSSSGGAGGS